MYFLRNPEVRYVFWPNLTISAAVLFALHRMLNNGVPAGTILLTVAIALVLMLAVYLFVAHRHAMRVRRFSRKIERSLHGARDLRFEEFTEGDFADLQSQVSKMLLAHFRQEEALTAEKQMLTQSLQDISHQIKTPLAAISLTTEQLSHSDVDPLERSMLTHRMLGFVARIDTFVKTLLKISRLDANVVAFQMEPIPAEELITKVCDPLEAAMELREITFVKEIRPAGTTILGDKLWLPEALGNIVKNCMEHTPAGGKLTIRVTDDAVRTQILIQDTGLGIDPEDLPHIFERFYKGKHSGSNSIGIGLALTKRVIHEMNGTIEAKNNDSGGACFTIRLQKKVV